MKQRHPEKLFLKVLTGFLFCFVIFWFLSFRYLYEFSFNFKSIGLCAVIASGISFGLCTLLVKHTIKLERQKSEQPFSIVARDPSEEYVKQKITFKSFTLGLVIALLLTVLFTLPLSLIGILQVVSGSSTVEDLVAKFSNGYWILYLIVFALSAFITIVGIPSFRNWHWKKYSF